MDQSDCGVVQRPTSRQERRGDEVEFFAHAHAHAHAQGLTPAVAAFADTLGEAGRAVHTRDLFGGRTFDRIDAGVAYTWESDSTS